MRATYRRS